MQEQEPDAGPERPRGRRRIGWVAAIVGLIGLSLAGLGIARAQTRSSDGSNADAIAAAPAARTFVAGMGGPHGGFGPGRHGFGMGAIHGEFTTPAPGGGYQTIATQIGEVTAVSSSSITVKSEDGFSRTYRVNDNTLVNAGNDGIADVKKGDDVRITAVVSGSSASAVDIVDVTRVQQSRDRWAPPHPSATPTASTSSNASA